MKAATSKPTATANRFLHRDERLRYVASCHWHVADELLSAFRTIELLEQRLAEADREIHYLQRDLRIAKRALTELARSTCGGTAPSTAA